MPGTNDPNTDFKVVADHLYGIKRPLTYAEFGDEISAVAPASSDIHWMADSQLVNIFFSRKTAPTNLPTERVRQWIR